MGLFTSIGVIVVVGALGFGFYKIGGFEFVKEQMAKLRKKNR